MKSLISKILSCIIVTMIMTFSVVSLVNVKAADVTGTINFGSASGSTNINGTSVTGNDSKNNSWTITTVGTTSFTPNASYAQVGSSKKPATSITFTTTLAEDVNVTSFSAKFGGFSGTAGTVALKVGDTTVGSGSLDTTSDVIVNSTNNTESGTVLTVTVTDIAKGVKCYYISYTYSESGGGGSETPTYTVTFDSDGGSAVESQTVAEGGYATRPTNPTKSGYVFNSWVDENVDEFDFEHTPITADITLYAIWDEEIYYTVSFDTDGGSAVASQSVLKGHYATRPANPTKDGYVFDCWVDENVDEFDFEHTAITADITLYAMYNVSNPIIPDGQYFIVIEKNSVDYVLPVGVYTSAPIPNSFSKYNIDDAWTFELVSGDDIYRIKANGNYLIATNNNNGVRTDSGEGNSDCNWIITYDSTSGFYKLTHQNQNRMLSLYNTQDFRCYLNPTSTSIQDIKLIPFSDLKSIAINKAPGVITEYSAGAKLDLTGVSVIGTFEDDETEQVPSELIVWDPSTTEELTVSNTTVTASVTLGTVTKTASYNITVSAPTLQSDLDLKESYFKIAFTYKEVRPADVVKYDTLNTTLTGISGTSSYSSFSEATDESGSVYAGNCAGGSSQNPSIQLRSNYSNSGIVTTASGGTAKKITVSWNDATVSGRTLNVYGKYSAYSAATDLYSASSQGTLLGTIVCGTSTELVITGDYTFIGLRSADGAVYIDEISIEWTTPGEGEKTYSDVSCRILVATQLSTGDIATVDSWGLKVVDSESREREYDSANLTSDAVTGIGYRILDLGDVINNISRATVEFTICAYASDGADTYYSTNTKTFSVATLVKHYVDHAEELNLTAEQQAAVNHFYGVLTAKGCYA